MNGFLFLLPFILVASFGIYQSATADNSFRGYDYLVVQNFDGSFTKTINLPPYILNPISNSYQPFIANGTLIQTEHGSVRLNTDGIFSYYPKGIITNQSPRFTDKIVVKYADISNLNSWTYPNTLNNASPSISWDGSQLTSSKVKTGIGLLEYKYILNNGKWKTQLEATNLTPLTTKIFGFDQIIDLNSDTIKFGGIVRNLDNFNGTTFNKTFLDNNKGNVLDLMNGYYFDFDIAYDYLHSVTVYDTGINKSRLVFDFRTSEPLLPGETLILDPTFGPSTPTGYLARMAGSSSSSCNTVGLSISSGIATLKRQDSNASDPSCFNNALQFDISSIPNGATITDVDVTLDISSFNAAGNGGNCDFVPVTTQPSSLANNAANAKILFDEIEAATPYLSNQAGCTLTGATSYDLGSTADSNLQTAINSSQSWFAVGLTHTSMSRPTGTGNLGIAGATFTMTVTYTVPPPHAVTTLTSISNTASSVLLNWTAPYTGSASQNIIGYQINMTTPKTANPLVLVNDTGNTLTSYNKTGLTIGNGYSFRVSAWTNNTGGHPFNNATGNVYDVDFWTKPVIDLTGTANANLSTIDLSWSAPSNLATILSYMINYTTPEGNPTIILTNSTNSTSTTATILNLVVGSEYSFRVSPWTNLGTNQSGNIWNGTTLTNYEIGDLDLPTAPNTNVAPIYFGRTNVNTTHTLLNVTYPNTYNMACDFSYKYARTNQTYSGLSGTAINSDEDRFTFTLVNATGDLTHVKCWDSGTGNEAKYVITISDYPFLQQIQNLRLGVYGTAFQFGVLDGIALIVVFIGMIGFNRTTPIVGIGFIVIATFALSFMEIISFTNYVFMYPALALMMVWAFITTRKDD